MSIIVPRDFLLIIFLIFCLLIHLAEKVCASPLINPLSVSKGLLDLPAQSLFSGWDEGIEQITQTH